MGMAADLTTLAAERWAEAAAKGKVAHVEKLSVVGRRATG